MRKMHVPAYWPDEDGVHDSDQSGVVIELKKTMAISFDIIMVEFESEDIPPMSILKRVFQETVVSVVFE